VESQPSVFGLTSYRLIVAVKAEEANIRNKCDFGRIISVDRITGCRVSSGFGGTKVTIETPDGQIEISCGDINWTPLRDSLETLRKENPWNALPKAIRKQLGAGPDDPGISRARTADAPFVTIGTFADASQSWWDDATEPGWWSVETGLFPVAQYLESQGLRPLEGEAWLPRDLDRNGSPFADQPGVLATNYLLILGGTFSLTDPESRGSRPIVLPLSRVDSYTIRGWFTKTLVIKTEVTEFEFQLAVDSATSQTVVNRALEDRDWARAPAAGMSRFRTLVQESLTRTRTG